MPRGNGNVKRVRRKTRVEFDLKYPAISTNKLYGGIKTRSYHYKTFRKKVFKMLNASDKENLNLTGNLGMTMEFGVSSKLSDLDNLNKGITDVLMEYLGLNDKQIVHIEMKKYYVHRGEEYMKISLFKTKRNVDKRRKNGKKNRK